MNKENRHEFQGKLQNYRGQLSPLWLSLPATNYLAKLSVELVARLADTVTLVFLHILISRVALFKVPDMEGEGALGDP